MAVLREKTELKDLEALLTNEISEKPYRLTPYMVTIYEGTLTEIEIRNLLEAGLRIVRFKLTHIARKDKVVLLGILKRAITWCCDKYVVSTWPVAICVDLPNACIRTGYLKDEIHKRKIHLDVGKIVEVTSKLEYWNKCDDERIFIDDPYTLETIKPNTEISIDFGEIILICTEVVNKISIKCKVIFGGELSNGQFVCVRGVRLLRPTLARLDKQLLAFVKEYQLDVIIVHSTRSAKTLAKVRAFFKGSYMPSLISTICEQEGLDNIDEIIAASDGIILAREFLSQSLLNEKRLLSIQLNVSAKCRRLGKPFFVSGNVLEETLKWGTLACSELADVTNAVLQAAGLVLTSYTDATSLITTIRVLESVCKQAETISLQDNFWRMCLELQPPVTAAHATVLACAMTARQSGSVVVVVLSVTGKTAVQLAFVEPEAIILCVTANPRVARQLQLYRGIIPLIYDKKSIRDWYADTNARIQFAVAYGLKNDLLKYNQPYVIIRKSAPTSAFCDQISLWKVLDEETKKKGIVCPDGSSLTAMTQYGAISSIW